MLRTFKKLGLITLVVLFGVSLLLNVILYVIVGPIYNTLSTKGTIILSPSVTERLLADLKSGDKARIEQWECYLYISAGLDTNLTSQSGTLMETWNLYQSKERPGRSNYFDALVWQLEEKQQAKPLTRSHLINTSRG